MNDTRKNGEGLVVTENGQRVSATVHTTESAAASEAAARKKPLQESPNTPQPKVVQQIFG